MDPLAPGPAHVVSGWPVASRAGTLRRHPLIVVGAGLMGSQIGAEFAIRGFRVHFLTAHVERGETRIRDALARATSLGLVPASAARAADDRITVVGSVGDLPPSATLVLESLPEALEVKASVLGDVAQHARSAVLASNTSSLSITELGRRVGAAARTLGMHYWNPPMLMPLVELTATPSTDPRAEQTALALVAALGKTAVVVRRDVPGFIWNRLQMAILREALWLVENDVATIEDIDTVTRLGLARRWRQTGLFSSIYLGGPETWERVAANLFPVLSDASNAAGLAELVGASSQQWTNSIERRDRALANDAQGLAVSGAEPRPQPASD